MEISIVVPVYRGEEFIAHTVRALSDVLDACAAGYQVIVVSDGDGPATVEAACAVGHPSLTVIDLPENQGKGRAVLTGMEYADGRYVGFFDADMDIHPKVIPAALDLLRTGEYDSVVGSKRHHDSQVQYSTARRVYSWGFQQLVSTLFRVEARDTQVGAKFFRRELMEDVVPLVEVDGYAFDIEFLAVAARRGHGRIMEAPVTIERQFEGSSINSGHVWRMFRDTLGVANRMHIKHRYDGEAESVPRTPHVVAMRAGRRVADDVVTR